MVNTSNLEPKEKVKEGDLPAPELLRSQVEVEDVAPKEKAVSFKPKINTLPKRGTYRPSHRATFIGIAVVVAILSINAGVIAYVLKGQADSSTDQPQGEVTISSDVLDTLGVSRNTIGSTGTELVVNPDSNFKGDVTIGGDVSIAGQLSINSVLAAADANLAKLQAGDTTVSGLNVSGDATISNLNLRSNLVVAGLTQLQGAVTLSQLLTVDNSVNIAGNLSIGGILSIGGFQTNILTIGGHIITRGSAPGVSKGDALVLTDTVSISGNDISGTVAVNIGTGSRSGVVAYVSFVNSYGNTPHIVITPVGPGASDVYVNRSATGFSIGVSSIGSGGHAFDYMVMQ